MAIESCLFTLFYPFGTTFLQSFCILAAVLTSGLWGAEVRDLCPPQACDSLGTAVFVGRKMVKEQEFHMLQSCAGALYTWKLPFCRKVTGQRNKQQPSWLSLISAPAFSKHKEVLQVFLGLASATGVVLAEPCGWKLCVWGMLQGLQAAGAGSASWMVCEAE